MASGDPSNDIELLERVLLKFALTNDDSELEASVGRFLVPVLTKLASPAPATQKKVLEVLTHINKRVKPHPSIKLPLEQLLDRFLDGSSGAAERNFALMYLEMGLERSPLATQQFIVTTLLSRLGAMSSFPQHQDVCLQLFLATCEKMKITKDFSIDQTSKAVLLDFITDVLLYVSLSAALPAPSASSSNAAAASPNPNAQNVPIAAPQSPQAPIPAGLSERAMRRVLAVPPAAPQQGKFCGWRVDDWAVKKTALCSDFLLEGAMLGIFSEAEVFVPLLIASGDGHARVQRAGEDALKRLNRVMLEERPIVDKLYMLITGNASNTKLDAQDRRQPSSQITRGRAIEQLLRSQLALNSFPQNLQAAFESLFGATTTPRLKLQGLSFIQAVIRNANDSTLKLFGPVVLSGALLKVLRATVSDDASMATQLRSSIYQAIGALSKRMPALFSMNVDLLKEFFTSLSTESEVSVRVTLQECLADLSAAFATKTATDAADQNITKSIQTMLLDIMETRSDVPSRYLTVFYANRLFPFSNAVARHIDLIAASDIQRQVSDEAKRGLNPYVCVENNPVPDEKAAYPSFAEFMGYMSQVAATNRAKTPKGQLVNSFSTPTFREFLEFGRRMVQFHINSTLSTGEAPSLALFRDLLLEALSAKSSSDLLHSAVVTLLDLFCHFATWMTKYFVENLNSLSELIQLMGRCRPESRKLLAKSVGLVAPALTPDVLIRLMKDQLAIATSGRTVLKRDEQLGACLTLGYVISRCTEVSLAQSIDKGASLCAFNLIPEEFVRDCVMGLRGLLEVDSVVYAEAAFESLGLIGRFTPLPVTSSVKDEVIGAISKVISSPGVTTDVIECAALSLGNLTLGDRTLASNTALLESIYATAKMKQEELHFSVGDALSCIGAGWASSASADPQVPASLSYSSVSSTLVKQDEASEKDYMQSILNKLLDSFLLGDRADTRAAGAIWLLCILKNAGSHSAAIKRELKRIQVTFSHLLAENNEVVQEAASKGIVLVYELGDADMQNSLIDSLVNTLQSGTRGFKLSEDSQILPAGNESGSSSTSNEGGASSAMNQKGGSSSSSTSSGQPQLSTYKELLSLASEMNQPDLVYKFMNLATHHAVWNSKKGAAFATKTLAAKAQERLKPQLPKLIPKLFRSSYDPNPKIASAMTNILNSLVPDPKEITDPTSVYFEAIMKDLIENMFNKQWRTREASCLALSDLLISKTFAQVGPFLSDLWERCFKVLDDVKETVRKSAEQLVKSLSSLTLRLCDPSYTNIDDGRKAVDIALPFLLKRGLVSEVKEVRYLSVSLIQRVSKAAGFLLKPHIPELVETMLESLTALEPEELNYASLKADQIGLTQDDVDKARVEFSKLTGVNETLEFCLKQVDKDNVVELAPKLSQTLTSALGIASRIGAAQFVQQLAMRKPDEAVVAAPTLMPALRKGALASNRTSHVRKAFANSLGQLARVCASSKRNLVAQTVNLLLDGYKKVEGDDSNARMAVAEVLLELCRSASSALQPFYKDMVPLIFLARFDTTSGDVRKVFGQIWEEIGASIGLYLEPVVDILATSLEDSRWTMKQQASNAIAAFSDLVNDYQMKDHAGKLLKTLVSGMRGRIWTGKESFFEATARLVECCKNLFFDPAVGAVDLPKPEDIIKAMLIEAKKKNIEYKKAAIVALASVLGNITSAAKLAQVSSAPIYLQVQDVLLEAAVARHDLLAIEAEEAAADQTSSSDQKTEILKDENSASLAVRMNALKALAAAWPNNAPVDLSTQLDNLFNLLRKELDGSPQFTMRVACLNAIKVIIPKLNYSTSVSFMLTDSQFGGLLESLLKAAEDTNYASVRTVAIDVLHELISRCVELKCLQTRAAQIRSALQDASKKYSSSIGAGVERILELLENGYPSKRAKNM